MSPLGSMQLSFDSFDESGCTHSPRVAAAIEDLSATAGAESRGAIFTRAEVVDFILDLVGYTTKMRGGIFRFQVQYLRRIRIPQWADVSASLRMELAEAAIRRDVQACNLLVIRRGELIALIASPRSAAETGEFSSMSAMTGLRTFVAALAGHVAAEAARLG